MTDPTVREIGVVDREPIEFPRGVFGWNRDGSDQADIPGCIFDLCSGDYPTPAAADTALARACYSVVAGAVL